MNSIDILTIVIIFGGFLFIRSEITGFTVLDNDLEASLIFENNMDEKPTLEGKRINSLFSERYEYELRSVDETNVTVKVLIKNIDAEEINQISTSTDFLISGDSISANNLMVDLKDMEDRLGKLQIQYDAYAKEIMVMTEQLSLGKDDSEKFVIEVRR